MGLETLPSVLSHFLKEKVTLRWPSYTPTWMMQNCKGILLTVVFIHTLLLHYIWNGLLSESEKVGFFQKNLTLLNSSWTQPAHLRYFTVRKYLNNNWKKQTNKPPTINKRFIYAKEVCFFPLTCVFKKLVTVYVRKKTTLKYGIYVCS